MRIIPVVDILNEQVVQGVRGERDKYKPIKSKICDSANILEVVSKFVELFNFKEFYIADLDAITKDQEQFEYLENVLNIHDIKINIDAGISSISRVKKILDYGIDNLIIGTETLTSMNLIDALTNQIDNQKLNIIISIDMYQGKILTKCDDLRDLSIVNVVKKFEKFGIEEFIILDLSRVGSRVGGISNIVCEIITTTDSKIITGGGINTIDEIRKISKTGIDAVLIATAFHNGSISPIDIKKFNSER
ncbi:MAG: hypothetical protein EU549_01320 [Promethearchaeota archaeon]|nr:MAG: hypothetical protein EU549_01320 [Candidatus Lokiarchaeota archaeon]